MTLLIDAYNVLKRGQPSSAILASEAQRFIELMQRYAKQKNHLIVVVFDGGNFQRPTSFVDGMVTTIYAGYGRSADDVIIDQLPRYRPDEAAVVTSDREICTEAARYEIPSIEAEGFVAYIQSVVGDSKKTGQLPQNGKLHKRVGHESSEELDRLMIESCGRVQRKREDLPEDEFEQGKKRKKSKHERRVEKVVKKL